MMRRLRKERADADDVDGLVDAVLAALDVPEVQAKIRAIVGPQRSTVTPSHRGGGGRRGR